MKINIEFDDGGQGKYETYKHKPNIVRTNANYQSSLTSFGIVNTDQRPHKKCLAIDYEIK